MIHSPPAVAPQKRRATSLDDILEVSTWLSSLPQRKNSDETTRRNVRVEAGIRPAAAEEKGILGAAAEEVVPDGASGHRG